MNNDTLVSGFDEFLTKEFVKKKCIECEKKSTCLAIIDLLSNWRTIEAQLLLPVNQNKNVRSNSM